MLSKIEYFFIIIELNFLKKVVDKMDTSKLKCNPFNDGVCMSIENAIFKFNPNILTYDNFTVETFIDTIRLALNNKKGWRLQSTDVSVDLYNISRPGIMRFIFANDVKCNVWLYYCSKYTNGISEYCCLGYDIPKTADIVSVGFDGLNINVIRCCLDNITLVFPHHAKFLNFAIKTRLLIVYNKLNIIEYFAYTTREELDYGKLLIS